MKFRTEIKAEKSIFSIDHSSKIVFIGSCFSENISKKLSEVCIPEISNPFGVVYNPASLAATLNVLIENKEYTEKDLGFYNDLWFSWDHHSSFSGAKKYEVLQKINDKIHKSASFLKRSNFLFLSFGTAWIYRLKENQKIVSNCHKHPAAIFQRELLTVDHIVSEYSGLINKLKDDNPGINIIFTISPVRHWKDGAHGNQISKSILQLAVEEIVRNTDATAYFPSYEYLIDDLRDYRFYAEDLVHPNDQAIAYIWEKFSQSFFSDQTPEINREILKIRQALSHRTMNESTSTSAKFKNYLEESIREFQKKYPKIDISELSETIKSNMEI